MERLNDFPAWIIPHSWQVVYTLLKAFDPPMQWYRNFSYCVCVCVATGIVGQVLNGFKCVVK